MDYNTIRRGDIYMADMSESFNSAPHYCPVLVIQNDKGNFYSTTTIVASISSNLKKSYLPTHLVLSEALKLPKKTMVRFEQVKTIDKKRLKERLGHLDNDAMNAADKALARSLGLTSDMHFESPHLSSEDIAFEMDEQTRTKVAMQLCLCSRCAQQFFDSPEHIIFPIRRGPRIRDVCDYCNYRMGIDYQIIHKEKDDSG